MAPYEAPNSACDATSMPTSNPYETPQFGQRCVLESVDSPYDAGAFRGVSTGLKLIFYGICAIVIAVLTMLMLGGIGGMLDQPAVIRSAALLMLLGIIGGAITGIVGQAYCLTVPEITRSRAWVVGALVFKVLQVIAYICGMIISLVLFSKSSPPTNAVMLIVGGATNVTLSTASMICIVLFLRKLNRSIQNENLVAHASQLLKLLRILVLIFAGLLVLVFSIGVRSNAMADSNVSIAFFTFSVLVAVLGAFSLINYAILVLRTSKTIS